MVTTRAAAGAAARARASAEADRDRGRGVNGLAQRRHRRGQAAGAAAIVGADAAQVLVLQRARAVVGHQAQGRERGRVVNRSPDLEPAEGAVAAGKVDRRRALVGRDDALHGELGRTLRAGGAHEPGRPAAGDHQGGPEGELGQAVGAPLGGQPLDDLGQSLCADHAPTLMRACRHLAASLPSPVTGIGRPETISRPARALFEPAQLLVEALGLLGARRRALGLGRAGRAAPRPGS